MATQSPAGTLSRRATMLGLAAGSMALTTSGAVAQDATPEADHPFIGSWLVFLPTGPDTPPVTNVSQVSSDGSMVNMAPVSRSGPNGVTIASGGCGRWERIDARTAHFTTIQVLSNPDGAFLGTLTIDGYPTVHEDGAGFTDDSAESQVTIRDPTGDVVSVIPRNPDQAPLTATRIDVGSPGFPAADLAQPSGTRSVPHDSIRHPVGPLAP